ncbi:hypothetical protein EDB80DRAFT_863297 [Ilyonectria destructans]|nr:hypothetical protein EDB80DRAFT_863297 [Ilyonectria destructans]
MDIQMVVTVYDMKQLLAALQRMGYPDHNANIIFQTHRYLDPNMILTGYDEIRYYELKQQLHSTQVSDQKMDQLSCLDQPQAHGMEKW